MAEQQPERAYQPLVRAQPETSETTPSLTIKEGGVRQRKRRREDPEEGPIPSKRLRTSYGQRATQPLVRAQPDTASTFCCFRETTETTPSLTIKESGVRQKKRRREDPEEGPTPSKRLRTSYGQQATQPLVRTQPETSATSPSLTIKPLSEEGGVRQRLKLISTGQQPPHVEATGKAEDSSSGSWHSLTTSSSYLSDESSYHISSSSKTCLTTYSTADFEALYKELEQLGQGGFGSVFAGYRKEDRLPVAIKHIPMPMVQMTQVTVEGQLTDFPLEVSLMLRAAEDQQDPESPGTVVILLDWFQLDQELILVQERPKASVNLLTYMRNKGSELQEQDAKIILHQVVEGIQGLHSRGVLHRDIKPENLLVETGSETPRVRIIDLGCGCRHNDGLYSEIKGTTTYIPPEWFTIKSYRADPLTVWQLGVLLYEMLTGKVPYRTQGEIIWKMLPHIKSEISPNCKDFLRRCLNKWVPGRLALESLLHHPWLQ